MAARYGLTRAQHEELFGVAAKDRAFLTPEALAELSEPVETPAVVTMLRTCGYDVTGDMLLYFQRKGIVTPTKAGRKTLWAHADIDKVIEHCEAEHIYTGWAVVNEQLNLSPVQRVMALHEAQRRWPEVYEFAMIVVPGRPGLGEHAKVSFAKP